MLNAPEGTAEDLWMTMRILDDKNNGTSNGEDFKQYFLQYCCLGMRSIRRE